jgi:predicted enzyme related to lactoylglutathione lyase
MYQLQMGTFEKQNLKKMSNVICWFEIYTKDIERAKNFYSQVLGTKFNDVEMPEVAGGSMKMSFFSTSEENNPEAVSGSLVQMPGTKDGDDSNLNTMVYFPCKDCSIQESRVEAAGGKITHTKMLLGEHGFCSLCIDTEGNAFGLYSME